jgi:hypothetical protein
MHPCDVDRVHGAEPISDTLPLVLDPIERPRPRNRVAAHDELLVELPPSPLELPDEIVRRDRTVPRKLEPPDVLERHLPTSAGVLERADLHLE